jgi:hypothetical protein
MKDGDERQRSAGKRSHRRRSAALTKSRRETRRGDSRKNPDASRTEKDTLPTPPPLPGRERRRGPRRGAERGRGRLHGESRSTYRNIAADGSRRSRIVEASGRVGRLAACSLVLSTATILSTPTTSSSGAHLSRKTLALESSPSRGLALVWRFGLPRIGPSVELSARADSLRRAHPRGRFSLRYAGGERAAPELHPRRDTTTSTRTW